MIGGTIRLMPPFRSCLTFLLWIPAILSAANAGPNVVFILADDLSWADLHCYGNEVHRTPHLDSLAEEGMRFTQAYSPAPICSASRAAILTGKMPSRLHFEFVTKGDPGHQTMETPLKSPDFTLDLPLEEFTMAEALNPAGIVTGFFGKWHVSRHHQGYLGWSPTHGPLFQGFEEGNSDFGGHPYAYRGNKELRDTEVPDGEFPPDSLTDHAIAFVQSHKEEPFFLYVSHYYVHDPVHTRCAWLDKDYRERMPEGSLEIQAAYGAMVETLDHEVGRLLEALDEAGLRDNTIVIFTGDNGGHPNYTSNAPLRGSKWNLYEGGIRVPMIVRWPGKVEAGTVNDTLVHGCDLFPTFCEVSGAEPPAGARDGGSLVPVLTGASKEVQRPGSMVWHFPYYHPEKGFQEAPEEIGVADFVTSKTRPHSALRKGDWKLVHFYEDDRVELYDLSKDVAEQNDLAQERPELTAELRKELERTLKVEHQARFPERW